MITFGDSAIGDTLHGKQDVGALWVNLAEKGLGSSPRYWFSDQERVNVLTHNWVAARKLTPLTSSPTGRQSWSSSQRPESTKVGGSRRGARGSSVFRPAVALAWAGCGGTVCWARDRRWGYAAWWRIALSGV